MLATLLYHAALIHCHTEKRSRSIIIMTYDKLRPACLSQTHIGPPRLTGLRYARTTRLADLSCNLSRCIALCRWFWYMTAVHLCLRQPTVSPQVNKPPTNSWNSQSRFVKRDMRKFRIVFPPNKCILYQSLLEQPQFSYIYDFRGLSDIWTFRKIY